MSRILLAFGAAALAIGTPVLADPNNKGGPSAKGQGGDNASKADRGSSGGQAMKPDRGNDGGKAMRQSADGGRDHAREARARILDAGHDNDHKTLARDHRDDKQARVANRTDDGDHLRSVQRHFDNDFSNGRGLSNGCPPGLDRKDNGCLPPGQARKLLGARLQNAFANAMVPYQYRSWYGDDEEHFFRSGDGFIYRVNRDNNLIDGIIPLFGGGGYYARGDQWPDPYNFYNVPQQYRSFYADSGDYNYRYGDGAIYRVNSGSGVVDSIVALLAGDLGVGSRLPTGYDAYNVPLSYRDRYYDTADNWYRYNDGYIYQVDPKTRLISAVINALI